MNRFCIMYFQKNLKTTKKHSLESTICVSGPHFDPPTWSRHFVAWCRKRRDCSDPRPPQIHRPRSRSPPTPRPGAAGRPNFRFDKRHCADK